MPSCYLAYALVIVVERDVVLSMQLVFCMV